LLMRGWSDEDLDELASIYADVETVRWVGSPEGKNREETWRHMAYLVGHWELRGFGLWAVEELESGALVGQIGLLFPEGWPDLEVGWVVARPHWGKGYAPEAGRASMKWAQDELGADHVVSLIADDNERSARVAKKLGMAVEGRALILGQYDVRVFGLDLGSHRA
ncbi:MAG: GNAT family N-acetyltransferase, partial [Thermoleophilaceae bacterium]